MSETDVDIAHTCTSYTSVVLNCKAFGTHKSRTASSSVVIANWDSSVFAGSSTALSGLRAARIEKFYKHTVTINGEVKVHLLVSLSWFKDHPQKHLLRKPVTVWYFDLFQFCGLSPVQLLVSRAVSLVDKLDDFGIICQLLFWSSLLLFSMHVRVYIKLSCHYNYNSTTYKNMYNAHS